jgi:hypothetical protein
MQQNDICQRGRELFAQKDYEGALEEFNTVSADLPCRTNCAY